ncbi:MAG: hypothetical protein OCD02_17715 [Spirochaetaceae bacterium]
MHGFIEYKYREFWRLEEAYEIFKKNEINADYLPYDNYPMLIEKGEIFVIDYTKTDGTKTRMFYRSDGNKWEDQLTTENFIISDVNLD